MEKKSTILLTVVAVATLLVAVVGASFAFFAVDQTNVNGNVAVSAETAAGSDVFTATGSGKLELNVTNDVMMEHGENVGDVAVSDTDNSLKVTLKAGSGIATCTYQLAYASTGDAYTMTTGAANNKEYTLQGTDNSSTPQTFDETNMNSLASTLAGKTFTITNTAGAATTEQTWTFTARFYNLSIPQAGQMNKNYAGTVTVTNINCTNKAA